MVSFAAENLDIQDGEGVRREQNGYGARGAIAQGLCEPQHGQGTQEPASINLNLVVHDRLPSTASRQPPLASRPVQNSFNKSTFTTNPLTPWRTTGTPTSARSSEFLSGPFRDASSPAPEKYVLWKPETVSLAITWS